MSLLTIVQEVCRRSHLAPPQPPTAILSVEDKIQQVVSAANAACIDLARRYPWQFLVRETLFTTFPGEVQGPISIFAPEAFDRFLPGTFWNRTQNRQVNGPLTAAEWQDAQSSGIVSGADSFFRLRGNDLLMYPAPALDDLCAFEYITRNWNGGVSEKFMDDSDVPLFDEELVTRGARWKYLQAGGFDYGEAFREYENLFNDQSARDAVKRKQSQAGRITREGPHFTYGLSFGGTA